jgi:Phosphotransferase system, mannose/fructose/N-acetylgalactosamine-specific component IIC
MTTIQIVLLCIWAAILQVDVMTVALLPSNTIITGIFAGLVMGDATLGLIVGSTLQSYALGLNYFGGASIPNYQVAAIIVVALCGGSMDNVASTIALVGIPVAALTVQLDVLGRIINSYWQHRIDAIVPTGNLKKIMATHLCGISTWSLTRLAPVLICLLIGPDLVETLNAVMPVWLSNGFRIASGIFPAIGFVILLKYMPLKGNVQYLIIGFVVSACFGASTIVAAAIGLALALFIYNLENKETSVNFEGEGGNYDE